MMSYRPPDSNGSTSSSLHPPSLSGSLSQAETVEEALAAQEYNEGIYSASEEDDTSASSDIAPDYEDAQDSLVDSDAPAVSYRALETLGMLPHQARQDKDDVWASPAFNRPLIGTENDKEVAKRTIPYFHGLIQHLDETDWMFPTPETFRPTQPDHIDLVAAQGPSASSREAPLDLPIFQNVAPFGGHGPTMESEELVRQMTSMSVRSAIQESQEGGHSGGLFPPSNSSSIRTGNNVAGLTDPFQSEDSPNEGFGSGNPGEEAPDVFARSTPAAAPTTRDHILSQAELEMSFANDRDHTFSGATTGSHMPSASAAARNSHLVREVISGLRSSL